MVIKNNTLSDEVIGKLTDIASNSVSAEFVGKILDLIKSETSHYYMCRSAEMNLLRLLESMYNRSQFLRDMVRFPHYTEVVVAVAANSNYMTDVVVRNPEFLYQLLDTSVLEIDLEEKSVKNEILHSMEAFKSFYRKVRVLRTFKRRSLLRIGVRDIMRLSSLENTTKELSIIARSVSAALFQLCYSEVAKKYGLPETNDEYCIISLGKLGGNELNYSSDIDLVVFFQDNYMVNERLEFFEVLREVMTLFIEQATALTENGHIYRVDFRLRPDGRNSPLCRTLNDTLHYYETRGEDWERQMLMKADYLAGSESLYNFFISYISGFIYPGSLASSPLEQIQRLRKNILRKLKDDQDIKLSLGGIRDIEFSVQALQLLNGNKHPKIRTSNTLEGIRQLHSAKLLFDNEVETLTEAYIFYRRIEHYLQLMNDAQTHTIPESGDIEIQVSKYLGFELVQDFRFEIAMKKRAVSAIYKSVMGIENDAEHSPLFESIKFTDPKRAQKNYAFLKEGKGLLEQRNFDSRTIKAFEAIEEQLLNALSKQQESDTTLDNFARVIQTTRFPSIWYEECKNTRFRTDFLYLCNKAQKVIDHLVQKPELGDLLLSGKVYEKISNSFDTALSYSSFEYITMIQYALQDVTAYDVGKLLSGFAKKKIETVANSFEEKHPEYSYFVAGQGSIASGEMHFASDADIIFVGSDINKYASIQNDFIEYFNTLRAMLHPLEVDCRLRPEGKSSYLIWDIEAYKKYFMDRIQVWELQSLCKIKFISGNRNLFDQFIIMITERIALEKVESIRLSIADMRKKMYPKILSRKKKPGFNVKKERGGLTDIEFVTQFLILCYAQYYNEARGNSVGYVLDLLSKKELISEEEAKNAKEDHYFLKSVRMFNQILFNIKNSVLPSDEKKLQLLAEVAECSSVSEFEKKLKIIKERNHKLFTKYIH